MAGGPCSSWSPGVTGAETWRGGAGTRVFAGTDALVGAAALVGAGVFAALAAGFATAFTFGPLAGFAEATGAFAGAGRGARGVATLAAVFPSRVSFLLVPTLLMVVATRLLLRPTQSSVYALPWSALPSLGRAC